MASEKAKQLGDKSMAERKGDELVAEAEKKNWKVVGSS